MTEHGVGKLAAQEESIFELFLDFFFFHKKQLRIAAVAHAAKKMRVVIHPIGTGDTDEE